LGNFLDASVKQSYFTAQMFGELQKFPEHNYS
jgi:hypothetical protein